MIGIFAPYNRSETTAMAVRAATVAGGDCDCVKWIAPHRSLPAHPVWDACVPQATDEQIKDWAKWSRVRVWFAADFNAYRLARSAGPRAVDILVPPWHSMTTFDFGWMKWFDLCVCPTRGMVKKLAALIGSECRLRFCTWAHGIRQRTLRCGRRRPDRRSVFIPLDAVTMRREGANTLAMLEKLIDAMPDLYITLSVDDAPPRWWRDSLFALMTKAGGDRLVAGERLTHDRALVQLQENDVLLLPAIRASSGLLISQAQALGVLPVAWDIHPFDEIVRSRQDGVLVPCRKKFAICGAETAVWNTQAMVDACVETFSFTQELVRMQDYAYRRQEPYEDDFNQVWRRALAHQSA